MKCPSCQVENKEGTKICRKCAADLFRPPLWKPTWRWHLRTLALIYGVLLLMFFLLNHVLKPYMRQIPKDITPWLEKMPQNESVG